MEKTVQMKYLGVGKRRISWSSMGKLYSYVVSDGDIINVPESQSRIITGFAPFQKIGTVENNIGFSKKKVTKETTNTKSDKILNVILNKPEEKIKKVDEKEFEIETGKIIEEKEIKVEEEVITCNEIKVGSTVKVIDEENQFFGMTGVVTRVTNGGVYHVSLDGDEKKYRRLDNDILEWVND